MKIIKENIDILFLCLFEMLIGILLLIDAVGFTAGIIIAAGVACILAGIALIIKYFKTDANAAAAGQLLATGLAALLVGAFGAFNSAWFLEVFPVFTVVYGVALLLTGLFKVQNAVDMLRQKQEKWFLSAISAVLAIVCAVVIMNDPFASTETLWLFIGIVLIFESVFDIVTFILHVRERKKDEE